MQKKVWYYEKWVDAMPLFLLDDLLSKYLLTRSSLTALGKNLKCRLVYKTLILDRAKPVFVFSCLSENCAGIYLKATSFLQGVDLLPFACFSTAAAAALHSAYDKVKQPSQAVGCPIFIDFLI